MSLSRQQIEDLIEEISLGAKFFTQLALHSEGLQLWLTRTPVMKNLVDKFSADYNQILADIPSDEAEVYQDFLAELFRLKINEEYKFDSYPRKQNTWTWLSRFLESYPDLAFFLYKNITSLRPVFRHWDLVQEKYNDFIAKQFEFHSLEKAILADLKLNPKSSYACDEIVAFAGEILTSRIHALRHQFNLLIGEISLQEENLNQYAAINVLLRRLNRYIACYTTLLKFTDHDCDQVDSLYHNLSVITNFYIQKRTETLQDINAEIFVRALYRYIINQNWSDEPVEKSTKIIYVISKDKVLQPFEKYVPAEVAKQFDCIKDALDKRITFKNARAEIEAIGLKASLKKAPTFMGKSEMTMKYFSLFSPQSSSMLMDTLKVENIESYPPMAYKKKII